MTLHVVQHVPFEGPGRISAWARERCVAVNVIPVHAGALLPVPGPEDGVVVLGGPMMGSSVTREYSYEEGTLIIDAYDSAEKKMVWRGSGTVTVKDKPEKQVKQVENILKKLGKKWDKILAGKGK